MNKTNKEIINVEEYAKEGKNPPKEKVVYRFRVGKTYAESEERWITGKNILIKVGLEPSQHRLYQKLNGGQRLPIAVEQEVDLASPGLERFETIPLDPTEGAGI